MAYDINKLHGKIQQKPGVPLSGVGPLCCGVFSTAYLFAVCLSPGFLEKWGCGSTFVLPRPHSLIIWLYEYPFAKGFCIIDLLAREELYFCRFYCKIYRFHSMFYTNGSKCDITRINSKYEAITGK